MRQLPHCGKRVPREGLKNHSMVKNKRPGDRFPQRTEPGQVCFKLFKIRDLRNTEINSNIVLGHKKPRAD